ncbi:MAG: hypothetical protein DMD72_08920 [Gemmatimonadetes bacterium]|nr:MAG: hypothetical protein DMD72_08920 [Gemmatimonadota bacterium]
MTADSVGQKTRFFRMAPTTRVVRTGRTSSWSSLWQSKTIRSSMAASIGTRKPQPTVPSPLRMRPMKKLCLLAIAIVVVACNSNDKITDVLQISDFFSVRLDPQAVTLAQGGTQTMTVTAFDGGCPGPAATPCNPLAPGNPVTVNGVTTFRSTDTTVAKVDANGVVTAQPKAGAANIIMTLQNIPGATSKPSVTLADTTPVTVLATGATPPAVAGMTLTSSRSTNGAGSNDTLTITYTDAGGATLATQRATTNASGIGRPAFFSSNPEVATVGATGIIAGVKPGSATISARRDEDGHVPSHDHRPGHGDNIGDHGDFGHWNHLLP